MNSGREKLGSRLGFLLLSAGCAIGCGNVWKFPWMTGQYGGGGFVLVKKLAAGEEIPRMSYSEEEVFTEFDDDLDAIAPRGY